MNKEFKHPPLLAAWEFLPRIYLEKYHWQNEWESLLKLMNNRNWIFHLDLKSIIKKQVKTILITTPAQQICFANRCFEKMTGYSYREIEGKRPSFLQGEDTSVETRMLIKEAIARREKISASIVNYKKNGRSYNCKVDIFPIFDSGNELVNYLAIEEEV